MNSVLKKTTGMSICLSTMTEVRLFSQKKSVYNIIELYKGDGLLSCRGCIVSGDKGARDLRDIRQEGRIRDGAEQASVFGGFERYTKVY